MPVTDVRSSSSSRTSAPSATNRGGSGTGRTWPRGWSEDRNEQSFRFVRPLAIKRKLTGVYGVGSTANEIDEPSNDGPAEITFKGELPRWVGGKDLILYTIGLIGVAGARYMALEFGGPVVDSLPMSRTAVRLHLAAALMALFACPASGRLSMSRMLLRGLFFCR